MRLGKSCPPGINGPTHGVRIWAFSASRGEIQAYRAALPLLEKSKSSSCGLPGPRAKGGDRNDDERDRVPQARAPDGQGCLREGLGSLAGEARRALEEAYSRAEGARADGGCRPQPATVARRRDQGLAPGRLAAAASGRGGEGRGADEEDRAGSSRRPAMADEGEGGALEPRDPHP